MEELDIVTNSPMEPHEITCMVKQVNHHKYKCKLRTVPCMLCTSQ